jgi:hypothetical protein
LFNLGCKDDNSFFQNNTEKDRSTPRIRKNQFFFIKIIIK